MDVGDESDGQNWKGEPRGDVTDGISCCTVVDLFCIAIGDGLSIGPAIDSAVRHIWSGGQAGDVAAPGRADRESVGDIQSQRQPAVGFLGLFCKLPQLHR